MWNLLLITPARHQFNTPNKSVCVQDTSGNNNSSKCGKGGLAGYLKCSHCDSVFANSALGEAALRYHLDIEHEVSEGPKPCCVK